MADLVDKVLEMSRRLRRLETREYLTGTPWTNWTPTITQGVSVTVTVSYAKYFVASSVVILDALVQATSAGTAAQPIVIAGLPAAIKPAYSNSAGLVIGTGSILDQGVGWYIGALMSFGASDIRIFVHNGTAAAGTTPSFALANTDVISFHAVYEKT